MKHTYSLEEDKFLKDNVKGITLRELTEKFNNAFNLLLSESSIANRKNKLGLSSGIKGGQFQKGHTPMNKGKKWDDYMSKEGQKNSRKTAFKKGNVPHNHRSVGSERISTDGYIEIKIKEPNIFVLKHRWLWEQKNGKIPKDKILIFLDGNKLNLDLDNLALISRYENLTMNNNKLRYQYKNLTKSGINLAKVIIKTNERL